MKKISLYIFLVLMFFNIGLANEIQDYEIEGFSIGDSLLDHLSKEEIITEIEANKPAYNYLNDDFGEVYLFNNYENYDHLSFFVKTQDKDYIIYAIKGSVLYADKLEQCFAKQKEIEKEFSLMYKDAKERKAKINFDWDSTGESVIYNSYFDFISGDYIRVSCAKYKKSIKIKNNWEDNLQIVIGTKKIMDWFTNPIK